MLKAAIQIEGERLVVHFDNFEMQNYELFIKTKHLPEAEILWHGDGPGGALFPTYSVRCPARFAPILGLPIPDAVKPPLPLSGHLWDYQAFIVRTALAAKRYAVWADCGLGKTAMFLEWARQVAHRTGGRVVVFSPLMVIEQTMQEARRFYGDSLPIVRLDTRDELKAFCEGKAAGGLEARGPRIGITNYHKMIDGVLPELRYVAGIAGDETSILKTGGGVIKWNLVKSARGVEYKLSCTATPAPNEVMEYASQAAFLEKLRDEGEIIWTYFTRDKFGNWSIREHAVEAFYRFMASWSIYLRSPARFGFADNLKDVPEPEIIEQRLTATPEQMDAAREMVTGRRGLLFDSEGLGVVERGKLNQIAKGFVYEGKSGMRAARRIRAEKPGYVCQTAVREVSAGNQTIIWTVYDEEAAILSELLTASGLSVRVVQGTDEEAERDEALRAFKAGECMVLVSKPVLLGFGVNLQMAGAMIFSGWNDSYEQWYQALRRAYRYGQTKRLRVHVPFIPELEGQLLDNVQGKGARFETETSAMEAAYLNAMKGLKSFEE